MATVKETMLEMMDAAASTQTAAMMSAGDTFEGKITNSAGDTADWIGIEMEAGTTYTITVSGTLAASGGQMNDGEMDTILTLYDDKGGMVDMNDDTEEGLGSMLMFTPEVDATYYISVSTYRNNPNLDNSGMYTVSVTGMVVDPDTGKMLMGTERMMDDPDTADVVEPYVSGNDKLKGTAVDDNISGLSGDDTLYGMAGDDTLDGGADNDLLVGGPGADTLKGGDGDDVISYSSSPMGVTINLGDGTARGGDADGDTIVDMGTDRIEGVQGSMYDDSLTGSSAANKLWGLGGNDELDGLRRDDELYGGDGDDDLDGGAGDDTLEGGYGADMLTGGEGSDTASYSMSMMGVTVRLHSGQAMGGDAEGDTWSLSETEEYTDSDEEMAEATVADIENLTGSAMADILAGDLRNNTIMGGGGDDKIYGGPNPADADMMNSGIDNNDTLHGDGGNDMIFGGFGNDILRGGAGDDMLNGGAGADRLFGGAGDDMIHADATDIYASVADDGTITYRAVANAAARIIDGGEGNDTVSFAKLEDGIGATGNAVTLGLLDSALETGTSTYLDGVENIIGTQDDDVITGNGGDNVIEGHEGGDNLDGGANPATGAMGDTLSYEHSDDWVRVTLNGTAGDTSPAATTSRGHASGDTAINFENVRGSAHDDDLTGDVNANRLWGLAGDDDIDGAGGNDTIEGGAGADELDGGYSDGDGDTTNNVNAANSEVNTLSYATSNAGVTVNLVTASVSGGHATGDTIETYEESAPLPDDPGNEIDVATFANVTGSMHNDHLTGNHHDNQLAGGAGDDTLRGGASDAGDRSQAQIRGDVLVGGPGADTLDGGEDMNEKDDMVPGETEGTMVRASIDWAVYKHAMEGVTVDLSTNRGTGGEAMGDTLSNIELVWGSEKDDTFIAGPGGDIIEGDGGSDTVSYEASSLGVTVSLAAAAHHTTVANTGTGAVDDPATADTDESDPVVFPTDPDPVAVTDPASLLAGVPRLDAMGNPFVDTNNDGIADPGDNIEDEDDNPNANGAAGDRLRSIENLTGSNQKDMLTGDGNPNVLKGMGGDDTLIGGDEDETGGDVGDKLYGGDGDDTITGGGGEDMLSGGAGDDTLDGGADNDTINGGAGDDDLTGGAGTDIFAFSPMDGAYSDIIIDFDAAADKIDLSAFDVTAEQVASAISIRGGSVVINLEAYGGGRITLQTTDAATLLEALDTATGDDNTAGEVDSLSQRIDLNGDGDFTDTGEADGVFIL